MQRAAFLVPISILYCCCNLPSSRGADLSWTSIGPGGGGWIQAIACDPRDPQTIYLGCDVGGFYISRDGGLSWRIQNEGLNNYFVECIAVHPTDSTIVLLGMEGGVFKSTDRGEDLGMEAPGVSAARARYLLRPHRGPVLRPKPARCALRGHRPAAVGERWERTDLQERGLRRDLETRDSPTECSMRRPSLATWKLRPSGTYVLAATDRGLYRSDDGGKTWSASNQGIGHTDVQELAISPSTPRVVYCTLRTTARDSASWNGGVWRSEDGGKTWAGRSQGLARIVGKQDQPAEMTSHYKEIVVHPQDPDTVYVGDRAWVSAGVYKTSDGGRNWAKVTNHAGPKGNMDYGWITQWGPTVECMAISPAKPDRVVFGTAGHVLLTDNAGVTWQQRYCRIEGDRFRGNGLEVTCFNDLVPDPNEPGRLYLCYFDIGLLVSNDYGRTFQQAVYGMKHSGNCFTVVVDPEDSNVLWAGTGQWASNQGDVCRSEDRGRTWTVVGKPESGLPVGQTKHLVLDPTSSPDRRILYVTSQGNGIFRSEDGGNSWRSVGAGLPEAARREPRGLLLDPSDSKHLYLALGSSPSQGSGVYETLDGGQSWRKVDRSGVLADIQDFQADPKNFTTLYACQREYFDRSAKPPVLLPGGLFKSSDGGISWKRIYEFRFCSCVAVNPTQRDTLYVGTTDHPYHDECRAQGIAKSTDGGKTWRQEVVGLTCWNISCIRIDRHDPSRLYAGTGGNGGFVGIDNAICLPLGRR